MKFESRWPAIMAILAVLALLEFLPGRVRVMPAAFPYIAAIVLTVPLFAEQLTHKPALALVERFDIYTFALVTVALALWTLARLIRLMTEPVHEVGGVALLASSIAMWVINVIAFALLYWELDRGGPDSRAAGEHRPADIVFPETEGNAPFAFIDYLFFAYNTATAFSPTDAYPATPRMKMFMMVQSSISLAIILVVAGRAINILK